ncbi:hypothetical protein ASPBRDRAFT_354646 [Aspergillus brasiliensis CBS 101740]|uniref:Uncharacterized protein n=1 Tax=Aspergillus brasiliensis (strain CBS 101740 / IMI 381727 / IBT 21946) TaxID=767769 RepID=A0A1L9U5G1_ASPBC|nr:hypothetical protein ASPBRDRAFT_354646 [Aspergillus brasiliensis CBS 101740]
MLSASCERRRLRFDFCIPPQTIPCFSLTKGGNDIYVCIDWALLSCLGCLAGFDLHFALCFSFP